MISGSPMMVLTVACTSVTGVLGRIPDDIAVSPELSIYWLLGCVIHFIIIINRHAHHE